MVNSSGNLLICERAGLPGAWQFPQGGVDAGESHMAALHREVREEIGLLPQHYQVSKQRDGYRYLYPEPVRLKKLKRHGSHGQEQTYFLCHVNQHAPEIDVNQQPREFQAYRWIVPEEFDLDWVPGFKREVYRQVIRDFFNIEL